MKLIGDKPTWKRIGSDLVETLNKQAEEESKKQPKIITPKTQEPITTQNNSNVNKDGFIYIPSINLQIAKERTYLGLDWNKTHEELKKQNLRMPTIPEFIEFLKYLRANPSNENTEIYNEITEVRDPWRSNWIDAKFEQRKDGMYLINYKSAEKLQDYLTQDKAPGISLDDWLYNSIKQGLPKPDCKKGDLYY